jgi:hypothetical protein
VLHEEIPAFAHHRGRIGEKGRRDESAERRERPGGEEQDEKRDAERDPRAAADLF